MTDLFPDFDFSLLEGIDFDALEKLITDGDGFVKIVRERFPAFAWAADDPELSEVLRRAVDEKWTPETFDANFRATEWFTTRTELQRRFDIREQTDEATVAEELADRTEELRLQASRLFGDGRVDDETLAALARRSLRSGASAEEISGALLDAASGVLSGEYSAAQTAVRGMRREFLTNISDEEVTDWTRRILTGETTAEGLRALMREKAKSRFPALSSLVDEGITLADYFSDQQSTIASMMGMDADSVDLAGDSRWAPVLGFADESGTLRPMTAAETQQYVRTTDGFYRTPNGRAEAAGLKRSLAKVMGVA